MTTNQELYKLKRQLLILVAFTFGSLISPLKSSH